jgi:digeranylgeranylglycerophospholipid reductase
MQKLKSDVTVIGAGPAGSSTAQAIAECGFDVLLVEKDEHPGITNVCAGCLPKPVIKNTGLSSDVIEKEISTEKHHFPWGDNIIEEDLVTVHRSVFDRCLAEKAVESGANSLTNTLIRDVSIKDGKTHLFSGRHDIESTLIVFADGPNTMAYRKFGIGFKPTSDTTYVSLACEVKWKNNPLNHGNFYYGNDIVPWGYGWVFPKRNTVNVGVACLFSKLQTNLICSLNYLLKKYPLTKEMLKGKEIVQLSSALIPAAPARRIFGEHVLVAGDAAGMVDPVTGGGIEHAIGGGRLAGKICVRSLEEEDFSTGFLSQYQSIWHKERNYSGIYHKFLASNVFLYLSKFDRNAYPKLMAITREGIGKVLRRRSFK